MFDIILKNGTVYDGTGAKGNIKDIAIKDGIIRAMGDISVPKAHQVIDVTGLTVCPGFIDMHTHSDFTLIADGRAESQVHQGVTTEVIGQCGSSCAPINDQKYLNNVAPWYIENIDHPKWLSFGEYLNALDESTLGVNVMAFVGHGTIHQAVLGNALHAGDHDDVKKMAKLIDKCMDEGAGGLSSGLEYYPGILSSPEHLIPMCEVAAKHGRLYATHVRNRDTHYDLGFTEAMATARQSGAKLQISHIQPKFGAPDHAMEHTLEMIELARNHDTDIAFDVIPHDWNHTRMMSILPKWAQADGISAIMERLKDLETRAKIKSNPQPMWLLVKAEKWDDIVLLNATVNHDIVGASFAEIGRMRNCHPYDAVLDILLEEGELMGGCIWTSKSFKNSDVDLCLQQSECAVISDTVASANEGVLKDQLGSLTGYGWAARFLQFYVRDRNILSLAQGISKLTSVPAQRLGLIKRGFLKENYYADICVFDNTNIASNITMKNPRRYATGIAYVLVNGKFSMFNGKRTDTNSGQVLREFKSAM